MNANPAEVLHRIVEILRDSPRQLSYDVIARRMSEEFGLARKTSLGYLETLSKDGTVTPRLGFYWTAENWEASEVSMFTPPATMPVEKVSAFTPNATMPPTTTKRYACSMHTDLFFATWSELEAHFETHPPKVRVAHPEPAAPPPPAEPSTLETEPPAVDHPPAARRLFTSGPRKKNRFVYPYVVACRNCGLRRGILSKRSRGFVQLRVGNGSCSSHHRTDWVDVSEQYRSRVGTPANAGGPSASTERETGSGRRVD